MDSQSQTGNGKQQSYLVLDGATGTELIARGFVPDPHLWTGRAALDQPELLKQVHFDYLRAGANILTSNTFRISAYSLAKSKGKDSDSKEIIKEARQLVHASAAAATEALEEFSESDVTNQGPTFLAGSVGPIEDCYAPSKVPPQPVIEKQHGLRAEWLAEAGCELLIAETMGTVREALTAVKSAQDAGIEGIAVSFIPNLDGTKLLGGESLKSAAESCVEAGAQVILVNCMSPDVLSQALLSLGLLVNQGIVLGAYANASRMLQFNESNPEWEKDTISPERYAQFAQEWMRQSGVRIIGACCGMGPDHIRAVARALRST